VVLGPMMGSAQVWRNNKLQTGPWWIVEGQFGRGYTDGHFWWGAALRLRAAAAKQEVTDGWTASS
jgi:hypothetical protein